MAALAVAYREVVAWAFRRFYREFAWTYDTVAGLVSLGQWYEWTGAAQGFLRGSVLELGCGTGHMQEALITTYPEPAYGLDASPQMIALARKRVQRAGRQAQLVQGDARLLPFADATFQTVLATFPSNYISYQVTLTEIRRVLSAGGQLVVIDAAGFTTRGLYEQLIGFIYKLVLLRGPGIEVTEIQSASSGPGPTRHLYHELLEPAGFTVTTHTVRLRQSFVTVFVAVPRY